MHLNFDHIIYGLLHKKKENESNLIGLGQKVSNLIEPSHHISSLPNQNSTKSNLTTLAVSSLNMLKTTTFESSNKSLLRVDDLQKIFNSNVLINIVLILLIVALVLLILCIVLCFKQFLTPKNLKIQKPIEHKNKIPESATQFNSLNESSFGIQMYSPVSFKQKEKKIVNSLSERSFYRAYDL